MASITFVIPYSPGGGFDTIVRVFAPALEAALGTTVVPDNVPGASGNRGGQAVSRADPDGYTIGIFNIPGVTVSEATGRDIGYKLADVTWIANLAERGIRHRGQGGFADQDRGRPVQPGPAGEAVGYRARFDLVDHRGDLVPHHGLPDHQRDRLFGGSNDTMIGVIRGDVDATLKPVGSLAKYTKGGTGDLRLIVTYTDKPVVDGVPTVADIGHPEFAKFTVNRVVGAPPGVPADDRRQVAGGLQDGDRKRRRQGLGGQVRGRAGLQGCGADQGDDGRPVELLQPVQGSAGKMTARCAGAAARGAPPA